MSTEVKELLGPRTKETYNKTILGPRNPRNRGATQYSTERITESIIAKLGDVNYKPVYYKIAWSLPEDTILRHLATAVEKGTNKRAYFIACCKNDMRKL